MRTKDQAHPDEFFVLQRHPASPADGLPQWQTIPDDASAHPLLTRLHGGQPNDVSMALDGPLVELVDRILDIASSHAVQISAEPSMTGLSEAELTTLARSGRLRFRIADIRRLELLGALELAGDLRAAGYPMGAHLLADGRIVLINASTQDAFLVIGEPENLGSEPQRRVAALQAIQARLGDPQQVFFGLQDFLAKQDCESPWRFGRDLYKYTACGPWVSFLLPGAPRGSVYYESPQAAATEGEGATWWSECVGLCIGSIVEGSDVEVGPVDLRWPFTQNDLDQAVQRIDEEADFYWRRDNATYFEVASCQVSPARCDADHPLQWSVHCSWLQFDERPRVLDFGESNPDVELPSQEAIQAAVERAGRWLMDNQLPDCETWAQVPGEGGDSSWPLWVRMEDVPHLTF